MEEQRTDLTQFAERIELLRRQISNVIVGQDENIDLLLTAVLANGHVLLEGVPGVAKTLLARLLAKLIDAKFSRVQFTPDLMPSDVLGTNVFNMKTSDFDFHAGPVFADIASGHHRWTDPSHGTVLYHPRHAEPCGTGRYL